VVGTTLRTGEAAMGTGAGAAGWVAEWVAGPAAWWPAGRAVRWAAGRTVSRTAGRIAARCTTAAVGPGDGLTDAEASDPFCSIKSGTTSTAPQRSSATACRLPAWRSVLRTPLSSWGGVPPPTVPVSDRPHGPVRLPGRGWTRTTPPSRPPQLGPTVHRLRNDRSEERPRSEARPTRPGDQTRCNTC